VRTPVFSHNCHLSHKPKLICFSAYLKSLRTFTLVSPKPNVRYGRICSDSKAWCKPLICHMYESIAVLFWSLNDEDPFRYVYSMARGLSN